MARVVIRRYLDFVGAQLDRTRLEGAGIRAEAVDRAGYLPLTGIGGGVVLEVDETDLAKAEELLADQGLSDDDVEDDPDAVRCPRCELEYTRFQRPRLPVGIVFTPLVLFAAILHLFTKKRWVCSKCEYAWDDREAGPRRMTPLPAGIPRPVFRLRRGHPGSGLLLGWLVGMGAALGVARLGPPVGYLAIVLPFSIPYLGWRVGRSIVSDVCSEPTCRAPLAPGMDTCRSCKGAVVGIVRSAGEHFAEAAAFRREMAEADRADSGQRSGAAGKGSGTKPKRKKGKVRGDPASRVWDPPAGK